MTELADLLLVLQRRARFGMALGLAPTRRALSALGDPELAQPAVHVAGSNGKGSTCAMIESIARRAGLCTGLFTSPHLCRFAERIRVDGEPIDDTAFARALRDVFERCDPGLTFFETLTVAAFAAFRDAAVDVAILEVGLGGRLDATNVVAAPIATAITSISLEHTAVLGNTIAAIAREKAGILKSHAPVVLGPLERDAEAAIEVVAREVSAGPIWRVGSASEAPREGLVGVKTTGDRVTITPPTADLAEVRARPGLRGPHQAHNAAVATGVAWRMAERWPRVSSAIEEGLADARWPGRLERIERGSVTVLLDCAHNPEGAHALAQALAQEGARPEATTLVFGALADKSWHEMLEILAPLATRRIYATPQGREAVAPGALARVAPGEEVGAPGDAVAQALSGAREGETVLVTGSIYLVGEVRGALLGIRCDPVIAL